MTYSETLARHLAAMTFADLPASAVHHAKRSLADTIGVALAAHDAKGMAAVARFCEHEQSASRCSVWSSGLGTSPRLAAFANSAHAAALDFDSLHGETAAHADIVIVPTVLAVAQARRLDGKSVLAAIALGDDLMCRLARTTRQNQGWFYTALHGGIASAAVTARLLDMDASGIANAMGLAFCNAGGTQQAAVERSTAKRIQGAIATLQGVACGQLAAAGMDGPRQILEGSFGMQKLYELGCADEAVSGLGTRFEGESISYKAFPACLCSHAAIDAALRLQGQHAMRLHHIASARVSISPYMNRLVGAPFDPSKASQVDAQFSLQYCLARALAHGCLGIEDLSDTAIRDPDIGDLASRIHIDVDASNTGNYAPIALCVHLKDGRVLETTSEGYPGSLDRPLDDAALAVKIRECLRHAGSSPASIDVLMDCIFELEKSDAESLARCIANCRPMQPESGR